MSKDKIVVIGAGLAGLTAAYRLLQKNKEVFVFEARKRVGGRIHTILMRNSEGTYSPTELGGQNISDSESAKNILALAQELNIEIQRDQFLFQGLFFDGKTIHSRQEECKKAYAELHNLIDSLESVAKNCRSLQELLNKIPDSFTIFKRILTFMINGYEGLPPSLLSAQPHNVATLKFMMLGGVSQAYQAINNTLEMERITLPQGNAAIPLKLAEKLQDRICLGKILTQVRANDRKDSYPLKKEMILSFSDGTEVTCTHLILAIPCSTFKNIDFDPLLINADRLKTIQNIQYGTNAKILVALKKKITSENFVFSDTVGSFFNQDKKAMNLYFINDDGKNIYQRDYFDNALTMLKHGYKNADFDDADPIKAVEEQYCQYETPVIKSWIQDIYSQGSYSTYDIFLQDKIDLKIQYKNIMVKEIFAPIDDRIYFVGEHATILDEIGTMEGAVESGERLATLF